MDKYAKLAKEVHDFRRKHLSELLGLETDPDGEECMLLIRDENDNITEWISFSNEVEEIISYIEFEVKTYIEAHLECINL